MPRTTVTAPNFKLDYQLTSANSSHQLKIKPLRFFLFLLHCCNKNVISVRRCGRPNCRSGPVSTGYHQDTPSEQSRFQSLWGIQEYICWNRTSCCRLSSIWYGIGFRPTHALKCIHFQDRGQEYSIDCKIIFSIFVEG